MVFGIFYITNQIWGKNFHAWKIQDGWFKTQEVKIKNYSSILNFRKSKIYTLNLDSGAQKILRIEIAIISDVKKMEIIEFLKKNVFRKSKRQFLCIHFYIFYIFLQFLQFYIFSNLSRKFLNLLNLSNSK